MSLYIEEEGEMTLPVETEEIARLVVDAALDYVACPYEAQVNLLLTTDEEIRKLNHEFRQIDRATDVLSFPMLDFAQPGDFSGWRKKYPTPLTRSRANCCWVIS